MQPHLYKRSVNSSRDNVTHKIKPPGLFPTTSSPPSGVNLNTDPDAPTLHSCIKIVLAHTGKKTNPDF